MELVSRINERATPGSHLPAHSPFRAEPLGEEILVILLEIDIDTPTFAVDYQFDKIGFHGGDVIARDAIVKHLSHKRGIDVPVEQVERFVAV